MFLTRIIRSGKDLTGSESLAFFRIVFGLLLFVAEVRFIAKGWISDFYVKPQFFFPFYGFEWLKPLPEPYIYWVFYGLVLLSVLITIGLFYRPAIIIFFFLFTYIELLDKSVYLNHYYQVSMVSLLMCFLPMNGICSLDNRFFPKTRITKVPLWMLWSLRLQVGMVYFFGGIAKLRHDWLFEAQPLRIWLSANTDFPIIGHFLDEMWVAYAVSWFAMLFDLSAVFFLSNKNTRVFMYVILVIFHLLTHFLFYIGMFPWMMIFTALIFFPPHFHQKILDFIPGRNLGWMNSVSLEKLHYRRISAVLMVFFTFQILMPFRSHLYQGNVLWHEQGFRFSWNIMLMEKNASLEFEVKVKESDKEFTVKPAQFLSRVQARQCSFQPDMILQFAHMLHDYYLKSGVGDTEIRAVCHASVNGHGSELLIDPNTDLVQQKDSFAPKEWITKWRH
jgi:hypothetical protein